MALLKLAKSILEVAATVGVIAASAVVIWTLVGDRSATSPGPQQDTDATGLRIEAARVTNVLGQADVAIVEFSDFECPFCATYSQGTFPRVEQELIETGAVRYVSFHFPLERIHPSAMKASQAAECAAVQGRYWDMHERMFAESPALGPADLTRHAEAIGLDLGEFENCLAAEETADKVRADMAEGERLGVAATPTFFIGRVEEDGAIELVTRFPGAVPFDSLKQAVDTVTLSLEPTLR